MITQARNALVLLAVAAVGLFAWGWAVPPNGLDDDDDGRIINIIAQTSNDSLIINVQAITAVEGTVLNLHGHAVGNNSWDHDLYVQAGDRVNIAISAWVRVEDRGDYGTVLVRIVDNGQEVRRATNEVPSNRRYAVAGISYRE